MFSVNKDKIIDIELLQKMISKFNISEKPKLKRAKDYYDGKQMILNKCVEQTRERPTLSCSLERSRCTTRCYDC